jgi:hypothetical protein
MGGKFKFKNVTTQEELTTNRSLVMYENIDCDPGSYTFDSNIPRQLINSTINKELIPFIMKLSVRQIKLFHNIILFILFIYQIINIKFIQFIPRFSIYITCSNCINFLRKSILFSPEITSSRFHLTFILFFFPFSK